MQKMNMNPEHTTIKYSRYLVKVLMKRYQSMPRFGTRFVKLFVTSYVSINVSQLHPRTIIVARLTQMNQNRKQKRKTINRKAKWLSMLCCQSDFFKRDIPNKVDILTK